MEQEHDFDSVDDLAAAYGAPSERAANKELTALDAHCRTIVAHSPFLTLATAGKDGTLDCSPRGDAPGFVRVIDDHTLAIPDRKGNNRADSLKNILEHPQVGILFMIPGMNETLRVNGRARISRDPQLCESFTVNGRAARSVLLVTVEQAFLQCAKALVRSKLWDPDARVERQSLPSMGRMLADHVKGLDAEAFDREAQEMARNPDALY